jgi:hypothetical protein
MNASNPTQPSTANNAINAEGNVLAGNNFTEPPLNAEGSKPARNDPAQPPELPPFAEHAINAEVNAPAGNKDIIVGDYHIDGVADIIGEESHQHVIAFYKATIPLIAKVSQSNWLMTKAKFETIKEALLRNHDGESIAELRSDYPQIYKWNMAFAVVINEESVVIVARPKDIAGHRGVLTQRACLILNHLYLQSW